MCHQGEGGSEERAHRRAGEAAVPRRRRASEVAKARELHALAEWLTPHNPMFAQAQVNRIWYHLMGRGLVDPIDDFRATNPAEPSRVARRAGEGLRRNTATTCGA